jgi:hypothetical protein
VVGVVVWLHIFVCLCCLLFVGSFGEVLLDTVAAVDEMQLG